MAHANAAVVMAAAERLSDQLINEFDWEADEYGRVANFLVASDLIAQNFYDEVAKDLGIDQKPVGGTFHTGGDTIPAKLEKGYVLGKRISEPVNTAPHWYARESTLADGGPNVIVGRD